MSIGLQATSIAVAELLAQMTSSILEKSDESAQTIQWLNQIPGMGRALAILTLVCVAAAAISKLTGNLGKILDFWAKYLKRTSVELSEQQLEHLLKSLLIKIKTDVAKRLDDSLHNLIRVDIEQEEQRHQVGRRKLPLAKVEEEKSPFRNIVQRGLSVFSRSPEIEPVPPTEKTYNDDIGGRLLICKITLTSAPNSPQTSAGE